MSSGIAGHLGAMQPMRTQPMSHNFLDWPAPTSDDEGPPELAAQVKPFAKLVSERAVAMERLVATVRNHR